MSKVRILSPRPEINKNVAFYATFLFILVGFGFKRQIFFVGFESYPRHGVPAGHS